MPAAVAASAEDDIDADGEAGNAVDDCWPLRMANDADDSDASN